jgi:hypothetical protein
MLKRYFFALVPCLVFFTVRVIAGFNGLYGQDAFEYLRYTNCLREFILHGTAPGNFFWPVGYPLCGALLSFLTQDAALALQLVSFLSLLLGGIFIFRLIEISNPQQKHAGIFTALFFACCPFLLRAGMLCMSDMACAALVAGFALQAVKFRQTGNGKHLAGLMLFGAGACMMRYAAPVLLLVPSLWVLPLVFRKNNWRFFLAGLAGAALILLPHFLLRADAPTAFLGGHQLFLDWSPANYFRSSFETIDGASHYPLVNIVFVFAELFHPGFFICALPMLFMLIRSGRLTTIEKVLLASVIVYLLFIAGMPVQSSRFFVPLMPLFILLCYRGFELLMNPLRESLRRMAPLIILFQLAVFIYGIQPYISRNRLEREIFSWINSNTTQPVLYSFDMDISLRGYGLKKQVNNLWEKRYGSFERNSLVLFNPSAFEMQWKGRNPMLNWEAIKKNNDPQLIHSFSQGWQLYELR